MSKYSVPVPDVVEDFLFLGDTFFEEDYRVLYRPARHRLYTVARRRASLSAPTEYAHTHTHTHTHIIQASRSKLVLSDIMGYCFLFAFSLHLSEAPSP